MTVVLRRMTVDVSTCDASATITNSESVTLSFNSKTGPPEAVSRTGARLDTMPAVGYNGSSKNEAAAAAVDGCLWCLLAAAAVLGWT